MNGFPAKKMLDDAHNASPIIGIEKKSNKGWENIIPKPLHTRWLDKVGEEDNNGCWPWIGAKWKAGYGKIQKNKKFLSGHRVSYELNVGKIPKGLLVLHKCDNPSCVNPDHLFLGTQADNINDMYSKKRGNPPKGENHPHSKFKNHHIRNIRKMYKSGHTQTEIARKFNTFRQTIHLVVHNKLWRDI